MALGRTGQILRQRRLLCFFIPLFVCFQVYTDKHEDVMAKFGALLASGACVRATQPKAVGWLARMHGR